MNKQKIVNSVSHKSPEPHEVPDDPLACLPQTFASRGVRTPFTTKTLRYARVSIGKAGRKMIMLPGLSGGLGTYELPLDTLREVFDLSVHDRMLYDRLIELEDVRPQTVLEHSRDVGSTGVGGVELARTCTRRNWTEKASRELGQMAVLHQALRQLGGDAVKDMKREELMTTEGQIRARRALNRFASEHKVANDTIIDSLGEWSKMIAPVGLDLEGCQGQLRVLANGLKKFAQDIEEWSNSEQSDFRFMAGRIVSATRSTSNHALKRIEEVDSWNSELGKVLTDWETAKKAIGETIEYLWWLLDGWQELIDVWDRRSLTDRAKQRETVEEVASFAPVLPLSEIEQSEQQFWADVRVNQMLWAGELRKLGSGEIDADMMDRLERFRRQSA
ncbi:MULTISPECIES: hypothetical protein [Thalassospira]|jgi:hypothetical protein|nr:MULTISPECIES: hypothetical protein [Thalassospira]NJB73837.1 hypothetical protein [Thalassospira tepidiphila]